MTLSIDRNAALLAVMMRETAATFAGAATELTEFAAFLDRQPLSPTPSWATAKRWIVLLLRLHRIRRDLNATEGALDGVRQGVRSLEAAFPEA